MDRFPSSESPGSRALGGKKPLVFRGIQFPYHPCMVYLPTWMLWDCYTLKIESPIGDDLDYAVFEEFEIFRVLRGENRWPGILQ